MAAIRIRAALIALLVGRLLVALGYFSIHLQRDGMAMWLPFPGLMVFGMTGGVHGSYRFSGFAFLAI